MTAKEAEESLLAQGCIKLYRTRTKYILYRPASDERGDSTAAVKKVNGETVIQEFYQKAHGVKLRSVAEELEELIAYCKAALEHHKSNQPERNNHAN